MVVAVWSVKGGSGATSVAAMLAIGQAERAAETVLVDLCGDVPAILGVDDAVGDLGVVDWCAMSEPSSAALARLEIEVRPSLRVIPRGSGGFANNLDVLLAALVSSRNNVIVDCGLVGSGDVGAAPVLQGATTSLLVVRECFLTLRAAQHCSIVPTGVVVIKEPGRQLGRSDVEAVTGAPVIAEFAFDPSIARSIDSGLIRSRLPRPLVRAMGKVLANAA